MTLQRAVQALTCDRCARVIRIIAGLTAITFFIVRRWRWWRSRSTFHIHMMLLGQRKHDNWWHLINNIVENTSWWIWDFAIDWLTSVWLMMILWQCVGWVIGRCRLYLMRLLLLVMVPFATVMGRRRRWLDAVAIIAAVRTAAAATWQCFCIVQCSLGDKKGKRVWESLELIKNWMMKRN